MPNSSQETKAATTKTSQAPASAATTTPPIELPPEPKYEWMAATREITTTVIALTILGISVYMMLSTFSAASDFSQMKDVLLYALPILGTVMGYYFGRVPAERRAEASDQRAGAAQITAQNATAQATEVQNRTDQKLHEVKVAVERAKAKIEEAEADTPPQANRGRGGVLSPEGGSQANTTNRSSALAELNGISKML